MGNKLRGYLLYLEVPNSYCVVETGRGNALRIVLVPVERSDGATKLGIVSKLKLWAHYILTLFHFDLVEAHYIRTCRKVILTVLHVRYPLDLSAGVRLRHFGKFGYFARCFAHFENLHSIILRETRSHTNE
jgi:hypothetical protein